MAYGTRRCVYVLWQHTVRPSVLFIESFHDQNLFTFGRFVIGSVQEIERIPAYIKDKFKTAWEIGPESLISQAVDRAPYVCQSQSITLSIQDPTPEEIVSVFKLPS